MQAGKLTVRPYIPLLKESNIRKGFFEPEQFTSVRNHLSGHMQPIVEFANITGWRTPSEILPLEWRRDRERWSGRGLVRSAYHSDASCPVIVSNQSVQATVECGHHGLLQRPYNLRNP
jgi:hypothetical protein